MSDLVTLPISEESGSGKEGEVVHGGTVYSTSNENEFWTAYDSCDEKCSGKL